MPTIRTGYFRGVIIASILLVVLIAAEAVGFLAGFFPTTTGSIVVAVGIAAFVAIYIGIIDTMLIRIGRIFQAAARGDDQRVPRVLAQPDPARAMAVGATLRLERSTSFWRIGQPLIGVSAVTLAILLLFEFALGAFFPVLPWSGLLAAPATAVVPIFWQWAIVAGIAAIFLLLLGSFIVSVARETHTVIIADDTGITVNGQWRRTKHIDWGEIRIILRISGFLGDQDLSPFRLLGPRRSVVVTLASPFLQMERIGSSVATNRQDSTFVGGLDDYRAKAETLLATISARAHVPVRAFPQGYYGPLSRKYFPLLGLTAQDVARMPLADTAATVPAEAHAWAAQFSGTLRLPRSLPKGWVVTYGGLILSISGTLFVVAGVITALSSGIPFKNERAFLIYIAIYVVFMLLFQVPLYIWGIGRTMFPGIVATPQGISLGGGWLQRIRQIPWDQIRVWGIEQPTSPKGQTTYALFWSGRTITWFEPASPRPVYRTMLGQVHALIAARTGLPPHQIVPHQ